MKKKKRTDWKALALKRGRQLSKAIEALEYARDQANIGSQLRGIETETYCAWINERCRDVLKIL